ncbi:MULTISPECIES: hypothetical protein [unclassified Streptomyces]|uniref:hypothetical protein n=1 Tax=unclassified Streptomyces TaxID=2593676 RepID=UPI00255737A0|nr:MULTISPECIES: hypothetical protein [unclassified Streptomyces]WRZ62709.1 hypothetical protein OG408_01940 [Streptomyces sp. NBC_01257]
MKIDSENERGSVQRRWGVPLAVATGVVAMSVTAVTVLSGTGDATPHLAGPAGNPTRAASSPSPKAAQTRESSAPDTYTVTSGKTTPIDAGTAARILASCLGSDASRFHSVVAVRTPVATKDWDGVVVAVDSAGQYVQCQSKGDKGSSQDHPPTFINNRLWGTGRTIGYFDSFGPTPGQKQGLVLGAGHYTSGIAKITVSYDDNPKQYPAVMAGGAFVYAAAVSADHPKPHSAGPNAYVHAYNASGKEIYNQKTDPQFADQP